MDDSAAAETGALVPSDDRAGRAPSAARRGGGLATVLALLAVALAAAALWRAWTHGNEDGATRARDADLAARVEGVAATGEQLKRDVAALRGRLGDADGVNRGLREEVLALDERSRHLEDAVANLGQQRIGGRDALAMNEAEYLLRMADERLSLFHDAQGALTAYRLADGALAAAEDPSLTSVRRTISAEMQALAAARPLDTQATIVALERLRGDLAHLPARTEASRAPDAAAETSRLRQLLANFVRIRHDDAQAAGAPDRGLARSLVALDLRGAEAALLARDPEAYAAALARARTGIDTAFDPQAQAVRDAQSRLARLASTPLAPPLPELGSALRELRNLRATRALAPPAPPAESAAPAPSPSAAGDAGA
jgi:uroporphyrin-3 C-methyltransferase